MVFLCRISSKKLFKGNNYNKKYYNYETKLTFAGMWVRDFRRKREDLEPFDCAQDKPKHDSPYSYWEYSN